MLRKMTIALMIVGSGVIPVAARAADRVPPKAESAKEAVKDAAETATTEVSDSWITLKTKMALLAEERVSSRDVSVTTEKGVISLRGKVESNQARQVAEEVARKIDGVKKVNNQLQVVPQAARKAVDRKDDQIAKDVEKRINDDSRLKDADISVRADKGIVTLTGKAPSLESSFRASDVAHQVPGVRAVRNEVKLERKG